MDFSIMFVELLRWFEVVGAVGSLLSGVGIFVAYFEFCRAKKQEIAQFEDGFSKEYRELVGQLSPNIFWDKEVPLVPVVPASVSPYTKKVLFRYIDLCNEQIFLRQQGRVSPETWEDWKSGIKSNLKKPVFSAVWEEIKSKSDLFDELRRLERENFKSDPRKW